MGRDGRGVAACVGVLLAVMIAAPVAAQIGAGALAGDIVDEAGAAVPGATVTVTDVGTSRSRTVVTSQDGRYIVPGLAPGVYQVRVGIEWIPAADARWHPADHR